jgi:CspA family cold shock protein
MGFIQADGGGKGAFVHVSALARGAMPDLAGGQKVFFDAEVDERSGKLEIESCGRSPAS